MTDPDLVGKKLGRIETLVREIRTLGHPQRLREDVREQRFTEHTLQLAIRSALDVASHIVSDERLGEPQTNRELFDLLSANGWIDAELARPLRDMAGFRDVLVHGYDDVDLAIVEEIVRHHLDDLLAFVRAIRTRMPGER